MTALQRVFQALIAAWMACGSSFGFLPGGPGGSAKNMVAPIYLRGAEVLSGVIQIEQARTEHARRLYFRIGALPQLGLHGVRVTVCDAARGGELLEEAGRRLAELGKNRPIEVRGLRINHRDATLPDLAAEWLRISPEGPWELRGVIFREKERTIAAAEGRLWLVGEKAGMLELKTLDGVTTRRVSPATTIAPRSLSTPQL